MASLLSISSFVSIFLIGVLILFVLYLLKSPWFTGIADVQGRKSSPNQGGKFLDCTRFPRYRGTAATSWEDDEIQSAFKDSWENGLGQNDETQSAFTDRAF